MLKKIFSRVGYHPIVILIFLFVSVTYFYPAWQGKVVKQYDVANGIGMGKEVNDFRAETGEEALWTNSAFGGMPTYQISIDYKTNIFRHIIYYAVKTFKNPVASFFIYMICFYVLFQVLGLSIWLSMIGAISCSLTTYYFLLIDAGHMWKVNAISFFPLIVAGLLYTFKKPLTGGLLFCGALGLNIAANHVQMTYYLGFALIVIMLVKLIEALQQKQLKHYLRVVAFLIIGGIVAIGANFSNMYLTAQYSGDTIRGKSELTGDEGNKTSGLDRDYVTDWSYGRVESFNLMSPNFSGGSSQFPLEKGMETYKELTSLIRNIDVAYTAGQISEQDYYTYKSQYEGLRDGAPLYWGGQQSTSGPAYMGAILCLLFFIGLVLLRNESITWWVLPSAMFILFLSWGKYAIPTLAALGFFLLLGGIRQLIKHEFKFLISSSILLGLGLVLVLFGYKIYPETLTNTLLDYFPMYNKFRAVASIMVVLSFIIPLYGIYTLHRILDGTYGRQDIKFAVLTGGGFFTVLILFFVVFGSTIFDFVSPIDKNMPQNLAFAFQEDRSAIFTSDLLRTLLFVTLALGVIFMYLFSILKKEYVMVAMAFLFVADLWTVDKRFLNNQKAKKGRELAQWEDGSNRMFPFQPRVADQQILSLEVSENPSLKVLMQQKLDELKKDKGSKRLSQKEQLFTQFSVLRANTNYRVYNQSVSTFNDASTSFFHKSIGGYHGAKLKRFQEVIENQIAKGNNNIFHMLNTKYFIFSAGNGQTAAQLNPQALGNAWFVDRYIVVENADAEMAALSNLDPKTTAVVDEHFYSQLEGINDESKADGSIVLKSYQPNYLVYESKSSKPQLAVFSEIFYDKGWNAYIDGEEVDHLRANYILRGLSIPKGTHKIEFRFNPKAYVVGEWISSVFSLLFVVVLLFLTFQKRLSKPVLDDRKLVQ